MARKRTGKSRKGAVGPTLTYGDEERILVSKQANEMPLAPLNPQAGQRFIDETETIQQSRERMAELDHEEAVVFRDGYIVSACEGNEGSVLLSRGFCEAMVGQHMEHNHPRKEAGINGGTFSKADLELLYSSPERMSVTASEGVYELRAKPNADIDGFIDSLEADNDKINKSMRQQRYYVGRCERNGFYKNYDEARKDSVNRQLNVIHEAYAERAEKYGLEYTFTPTDLGRERADAQARVDVKQRFMRGKKMIDNDDKYEYATSRRKREKALKRDGYTAQVLYDNGKEQIIGYAKDKEVAGIYTVEKKTGFFSKVKNFFGGSKRGNAMNDTTNGRTSGNARSNGTTEQKAVPRAKDGRPIATVPAGTSNQLFICQLDAETQNSIRAAVRQCEIDEGYSGAELEEKVSNVMDERLWVIEESVYIDRK